MRLGDYHNPGDAMGRKLVEKWLDNGGTGKLDRCQEVVFKGFDVVQEGAVALKQLDDQMFAK
jgi:hypothetical protein